MYSQSEMLMFYVKKFSTHRSANSEKEILVDFDPLHNYAYIDFCTPLADICVPYNIRVTLPIVIHPVELYSYMENFFSTL